MTQVVECLLSKHEALNAIPVPLLTLAQKKHSEISQGCVIVCERERQIYWVKSITHSWKRFPRIFSMNVKTNIISTWHWSSQRNAKGPTLSWEYKQELRLTNPDFKVCKSTVIGTTQYWCKNR
jgi:hypothetical protein